MKEINEYVKYSTLFYYYKDLFSNKQRVYLSAYLEEDNTISEIAQSFEISRQAVFENIKRGCKQLDKFEKLLGIVKREEEFLQDIKKLKKEFNMENLDKLIEKYEQFKE